MNPVSENISEKMIQEGIEAQQLSVLSHSDFLKLTEKEREFWQRQKKISFPLTMAYTPAYRELLTHAHWIHLMLLFFVIFVLCESFSFERRRSTRQVMQTTTGGPYRAVLARLLAGETISAGSALILYFVSVVIQFSIFGADGWNAPIQQIGEFVWSSLTISAGQALLLMFATSMLILLLMGALTMCLSELSQNGIVSFCVQSAFLLFTVLFDFGICYKNRLASQIWQYLPIQRVSDALLYDERLVSVGKYLVTAIPFSTAIYASLTLLFLMLCICHTRLLWRDRH